MDEPLAALDAARKAELLPYFERLQHELALPILYVSHSLDEVVRLAAHLVLLDHGRVLANGPTAALLTRMDLPLAHGDNASAVLEGELASIDAEWGCCKCACRWPASVRSSSGKPAAPCGGTSAPAGNLHATSASR